MELKKISEQLGMKESSCEGLYSISPEKNLAKVLPMIQKYFNQTGELPDEFKQFKGKHFDNLFILFTDSLGLSALNDSESYLKKIYEFFGTPYSTVFPSITNVALTSFFTGSLPAEHGIPGFKILMPEIEKKVDHLMLKVCGARSSLIDAGIDCSYWLSKKTLFNKADFSNKDLYILQPWHIIGSGLSTILYSQDVYQYGYSYSIEAFKRAELILENSKGAVVNLYMPGPDTMMHKFGPQGDIINFYIKQLAEQLKKFITGISPETAEKTLFLLVSDHGQSVNNSFHLEPDLQEELFKNKKYPFLGFSGRCYHVYGSDEEKKHSIDFIRKYTGDTFEVLDADSVIERYNNGIKSFKQFYERNGTLLSFKPGHGLHLMYKKNKSDNPDPLYTLQDLYNGQHGGASLQELLIPVILSSVKSLKEIL